MMAARGWGRGNVKDIFQSLKRRVKKYFIRLAMDKKGYWVFSRHCSIEHSERSDNIRIFIRMYILGFIRM